MYKFKAITDSVQVVVEAEYQPHRSIPEKCHHVWSYHVEIFNLGQTDIQLRSRHWHIVDGLGRIQEVNGRGVCGEEPVIEAGDCFSYSSGCPLDSDSGIMSGHYKMETVDGTLFDVVVPTFSLDIPDRTLILN